MKGERVVRVPIGPVRLAGTWTVPDGATGIVLFAHGSGSSRHSPRNRRVAEILQQGGFATLLLDLLTPDEEIEDNVTGELRFDIPMLADRLVGATDWIGASDEGSVLRVGYFGASTGAAAALVAAAERPDVVCALVSRGGRPDLARHALPRVTAPTLLVVGGRDEAVIELNRRAFDVLRSERRLEIVPGATHLFEEPGALEQVARLATQWFVQWIGPSHARIRVGA